MGNQGLSFEAAYYGLHCCDETDTEAADRSVIQYYPRGQRGSESKKIVKDLDLSGRDITSFLGTGFYKIDLLDYFKQITSLDISRNDFIDVFDAFEVCAKQMPHLEQLNLWGCNMLSVSRTRMCKWLKLNESISYPSLRTLNVGSTKLGWDTLNHLCSRMPALTKVIFSRNHLSLLQDSPCSSVRCNPLQNLEYLDLSENDIESWSEVNSLIRFKNLNTLILSNNKLELIQPPELAFPSIKTLHLDGNRISTLSEASRLNGIPTIRDLRLLRNPLLSEVNPEDARMVKIALFEHIEVLEGSKISKEERAEAELFYLWFCEKHFNNELNSGAPINLDGFTSRYPKYLRLCDKYDRANIIVTYLKGEIGAKIRLKSKLLRLRVSIPDTSSTSTSRIVCVPLTTKVCELKVLVGKLLRRFSPVKNLWVETHSPKVITDLTTLDSHTLDSFYLPQNSIVHLTVPP